MTQANNPRHISELRDIGRRALRFVNRQKDSGTRIIFEELLKQASIDKRNIRGYHEEEFTHVAVAAMLASGAADAGFGIKAAASKFGLHFIPILEESYVLAIDRRIADIYVAELKKCCVVKVLKRK